jgi:hypothetical protein
LRRVRYFGDESNSHARISDIEVAEFRTMLSSLSSIRKQHSHSGQHQRQEQEQDNDSFINKVDTLPEVVVAFINNDALPITTPTTARPSALKVGYMRYSDVVNESEIINLLVYSAMY